MKSLAEVKTKPSARRGCLASRLGNYAKSLITAGSIFLSTLGCCFVRVSLRSHRARKFRNRPGKKFSPKASKRVVECGTKLNKSPLAGASGAKFGRRLLPAKRRASFLKFFAASLISLAGYFGFQKLDREPYTPSWPHPERRGIGLANFKRDPTCEPFDYFRNPKVVLFLTTGDEGKAISNQILNYFNSKTNCRTIRSKGLIKEIHFYPQNGHCVEIFIVNTSYVNPSDLNRLLNGKKADLIFYRGHTNEMVELVKWGSKHEDRHCLGVMGGCNSAYLINQVHTPETPTVGIIGIAYTVRNSFWSYHILVGLCDPRVRSWHQFQNYLYRLSETASRQLVIPGTAAYNEYFTESTD